MKLFQKIFILALAVFTIQPASAQMFSPMPLISRNVPAYASDNNAQAGQANNANYNDNWASLRDPSVSSPCTLSYDLSGVPAAQRGQVLVIWYCQGTSAYNHTLNAGVGYALPGTYTLQGNAAAGGSVPSSGWVTLLTITGNNYNSRQHVINMTGYNWFRFSCTAADGSPGNSDVACNLDIYNIANGANDSWIMFGDSITANAMSTWETNFAETVNASKPSYYPAQENGGMGGWQSGTILPYIDSWFAMFPGKFVGLSFGTNDVNSFPNDTNAVNSCAANLQTLANKVIALGKIPVIPHIPWANLATIQSNGPLLDAKIDQMIAASGGTILAGPALFEYFQANPGLIGPDNLHPSHPAGEQAMRTQWGLAMLTTVYGGTPTVPSPPTGLTATPGNTQVALSWNASSGATAYDVKRSTVSGSGYATVSSPTSANYTNTGLTNGTTYYFVVDAKNSAGTSGNSSQASAMPSAGGPPPAPTGLTASGGNAQAALSWNSSPGATSYNVKRSTVNGSGYTTIASPTTTSYTNTGLTNGTTYYYVVTAVDAAGESGNSSQVSATPTASGDPAQYNFESGVQGWAVSGTPATACAQSSTQVYAGADSLAITMNGASGCGQVTVNNPSVAAGQVITFHVWIPSGMPITQVQPSVTDSNGGWFGTGAVATANAWTTVTLTVPSTAVMPIKTLSMQYCTSATWSGTVYLDSVSWPTGNAPAAPTGLVATGGNAQVALTWSSSTGATSYNVKRSTVNGSGYATIASPVAAGYTNTGLTNGTTYYYVVTAVNASGESGNSNQATATPTSGIPPAPTGLAATPGNAQVALTWNASTGATSYNVSRSTVSGSGYASVATGITVTNYTNTGLTNGTTYYFVVSATNAGGTSANSAQASATPSGSSDTAQYNFESGVQGWIVNGAPATAVAQSTTQVFLGSHSLAITMNGASGCGQTSVSNPGVTAGKVITFHVWIPSGMPITQVQPSVVDNNGAWDGTGAAVTANAWNTVTLMVPANAAMPIKTLSMQYCTSATWSGTVYLDSVSWP